MMIPGCLVSFLLAGAFALSGIAHYSMIALPNQSNLSWPFMIGLLAMPAGGIFLALLAGWLDWGMRNPVFLVVGIILLAAGIVAFQRSRPRIMG